MTILNKRVIDFFQNRFGFDFYPLAWMNLSNSDLEDNYPIIIGCSSIYEIN